MLNNMFDFFKVGGKLTISFLEYSLDEGFIADDRFLYALCGYIQVNREKVDEVYKLTSIESDQGFSLVFEKISKEQYCADISNLPATMRHIFYAGVEDEILKSLSAEEIINDVHTLTFKFNSGSLCHIVSGEYYTLDGVGLLSMGDEMLLVFNDIDISKRMMNPIT